MAALMLCPGGALGKKVLTPLRVVGESGFHHAGTLSEIVMLSDGERFLSTSRDGSARLWDLRTGKELRRFMREKAGDMWGVALLPGEREFLTAGGGGYVTRWDLATGQELMSYKHEKSVFRVVVRPGGKEFVATDSANLAVLWNLKTGKKVQTYKGHTDSVYTAMFFSEGKRLLTGDSDGDLKVWDVESGKCERTYQKELGDVFTIQPSPDGARFAMCSGDDRLRVFETETLKQLWAVSFDEDVKVPSWSADGKRLVTACEDKFLYLYGAEDGTELKKFKMPHGYHTPVVFSNDGRELISGGDSMLYRHNSENGKRIAPLTGEPLIRGGVRVLSLSGRGDRVYAGGADPEVRGWETESGERALHFKMDGTLQSMVGSPNGELLAMGGSDGSVTLRSTESGKIVRTLEGGGSIDDLVFARNGQWLVGGGSDEKAHLWETATGKKLRSFEGHANDINGVTVSKDSTILLTTSDDKTARLWDLESGAMLRSYPEAEDQLYGSAAVGDGRSFLVTAQEPELWGWLAPEAKIVGSVSPEELGNIVRQLAAEKYSERAEATLRLLGQGPKILPLLDKLKPDDPETTFRLKAIKAKIKNADLEGSLETHYVFNDDLVFLVGDPKGRYWAAVIGRNANSRIVIGEVRARKVVILQELADHHAPAMLVFSADGSTLASGNRDGTVSLFRVAQAK